MEFVLYFCLPTQPPDSPLQKERMHEGGHVLNNARDLSVERSHLSPFQTEIDHNDDHDGEGKVQDG